MLRALWRIALGEAAFPPKAAFREAALRAEHGGP